MSIICPTVLADNTHTFREQIERVEPFAQRIQIDLMDGNFVYPKSVTLDKLWLPEGIKADLHMMFQRPADFLGDLIRLKPNMVIAHAESEVDLPKFAADLRQHDIKCGVAILPETTIEKIRYILPHVQHVLIFGGKLGSFGGVADLSQLSKVNDLKESHRWLEVGWDGGASDENVRRIADAGVDVINVGGYIQKSANPMNAYQQLVALLG